MNIFYKIISFRKIVMCGAMGLILMGVFAFVQMPRQEDPSIKINRMRIIVPFPGADPTKTEKFVTKVIEEEIGEIDGIEEILSTSKNGIASIDVIFQYDTDLQEGIDEVKDAVRDITPQLPKETLPPQIIDDMEKNFPLIVVATGEKYSLQELEVWVEKFKDECLNLPGVINSELRGELEKTIYVSLDLPKISKYRIAIARVIEALSARNDIAPGGTVKLGDKDFLIQTQGEFKSIRELENILVDLSTDLRPIYLRDIATIEEGHKDPEYRIRYNGDKAVALAVSMRNGYNVLNFEKEVQGLLDKFKNKLPADMNFEVCINQAQHVDHKLYQVYSNLLQGIICVIFVLFFFIGIRESTIISISIPITVVIALFFLSLLGVKLEQISIASFVVALGLLVDNSIVVVENIHDRMLRSDLGIIETFADAVKEVAPSITSGTLTTISAFIPMLFMGGDVGAYIRSIPLVMITTLFCSLFVSLSVTPILYLWFYPRKGLVKKEKPQKTPWLLRRYRKLIRFSLKNRYLMLLLGIAFVVGSLFVAKQMTRQLFPTINRPQFLINVFLPEGGTLDKCDQIAQRIHHIMMDKNNFPEVEDVICFIGNGSPKFYFNEFGDKQINNPSYMEIVVNLVRELPAGEVRATNELVSLTQKKLDREISSARIRVREFKSGKAFRAPVIIRLTGGNLEVLRSLTSEIKAIVESVPGTKNVHDNLGESTFKVKVETDPYALNQVGLLHVDISRDIRTAFSGTVATTFLSGDDEIDVTVRLHEKYRKNFDNIRQLYFASRLSDEKIPFAQVASLQLQLEKARINRYNQQWSASILSDVEGRLADAVQKDIRKKLDDFQPPPGYTLSFAGENKEVNKSFGSLRIAGFFAVILIYLILATEFNSLMQPIIILFILPLSVAGAIFGLSFTDSPLGFMTMLGFVSLIGIVVNDAILLVDFANSKIKHNQTGSMIESMENYSAILIETAEKRLKPIFATSITTIISLLPLAIYGGYLWAPFGWTVITGLVASTFLTLVFVPCFFRVLEDIRVYLRIMPAINIHVYTKNSQLQRALYHSLSTQARLSFINPDKKIIGPADGQHTDMVIIEEHAGNLWQIVTILQHARHAPHINSVIISDLFKNADEFLERCARENIEISRLQRHLIESNVYVSRSEAENLSAIIKEESNKLGDVVWNIWQLSRIDQRR